MKKEIRRLRVIVGAMVRYGFGSIIDRLPLRKKIPLMERILKRWKILSPDIPAAERFRCMLEELGTTFIKLGQVMSLRKDVLPEKFVSELERLQERVAPVSVESVKALIQKEFGKRVDELFAFFEEKPLAAASIAQVHKAQLADGTEVVVKVQRPGIEEKILTDIEILGHIARLLVRYIPESKFYDPVGQVEEVKKTILKELNFETEKRHMERFKENLADGAEIVVPAVISELSSKRVLTMEMTYGRRITELKDEDSLQKQDIAGKLVNSYLKQVFQDGFFHADPHPGNILILEDSRLCFHDFGMMGYLSQDLRENLADWLIAVLDKDTDTVADVYLRIGLAGEEFNRHAFKKDMGDFIEEYYNVPLKEFSLAPIIERSIRIGRTHHITVPSELLLLGKVFITLEAVVRELDPQFNFIGAMQPYAKGMIRNRLSPSRIAKDGLKFFIDLQRVISEAPKTLEILTQNIREGKGELTLKHAKLEDMEKHIDRASNRLAFAIVIAAIIIGSSFIAQYDIGPSIWGVSAFGLVGYTLAGLLGLRLIWAIMKSGRM